MKKEYEFCGWLRRRPNRGWLLVCVAVTREWCEKLLRDKVTPPGSSRLVLPKGENPYLPARRKTHES